MTRDPYRYFRTEARELLAQLSQGVLDLEKSAAGQPELVQRLLRVAHTLKGAARVVKQKGIADAAHAIEGLLGPLRDQASGVTRELTDGLLAQIDVISRQLAALSEPAATIAPPAAAVAAPEPVRLERVDDDLAAVLDAAAEAHAQVAAVRRSIGSLEKALRLSESLVDQLRSPRQRTDPARTVAAASDLRGLLAAFEHEVAPGLAVLDRELRAVRESAERLRLLPARAMFHALERTTRDAALSVGKRVSFEATGGDVRLEASAVASLQQALVQLVRNAVAHGIETERDRAAAGKPPSGSIRISVERRGSRVAIVCSDDGRGIDVEAVRRALQRRGMGASQAAGLSGAEVVQRLFGSGVSTSSAVTEIAGRGVGLDVVREVAATLGGEVSVQTDAARGTTVELTMPVAIAAVESLFVEAGGDEAVVPLDAVERTVRLDADAIVRTGDGDRAVIGGRTLPFVPLASTLGRTLPVERRAWSVIVLRHQGRSVAAAVDRLRGTGTAVVRALPRLATADPVVAGMALDAEGNPVVVVDAAALVDAAHRATRRTPNAASTEKKSILVVDDSLTTRMLEQSILESAGYEVDLAVSGEEGLEKARQRRYSLFLVDVEMPGIDGFEFVARTRADAGLRATPAILVTSRNAPEDFRRAEEVGARGYVVKSSFDQNDLLDRIHTLVKSA